MTHDYIDSIEISTSNNDVVIISAQDFDHFYISNINESGDEISYTKTYDNTLYANFFMIKLLNNKDNDTSFILDRLLRKKDIVNITVNLSNGNYQEFDIAKRKIIKDGYIVNEYEETFLDDNDLCILVSDRKIKYKKNLFA